LAVGKGRDKEIQKKDGMRSESREKPALKDEKSGRKKVMARRLNNREGRSGKAERRK